MDKFNYRTVIVIVTVLVCSYAGLGSAHAQQIELDISRSENIEGVMVSLPANAILNLRDAGKTINVTLQVGLHDIGQKLIHILKASKLERAEACGNTVKLNSAKIWVKEETLVVKVDGWVAFQKCVKMDVPIFDHFRIRMKTKTVVSSTINSNAHISAEFQSGIHNNELRVTLTSSPKTYISNDLYRYLAKAFNLDDKLANKISASIRKGLEKPNAALKIPETYGPFKLKLNTATFSVLNSLPYLILTGQVVAESNQPTGMFGFINCMVLRGGITKCS